MNDFFVDLTEPGDGEEATAAALLCVQCKDSFHNAWDLMVHAQAAHMLNIYELGVPGQIQQDKQTQDSPCHSPNMSPRANSPDKVRRRKIVHKFNFEEKKKNNCF